VVVETFDHARAGVSLLRDEVGGRATFFVDSLRNLKLADTNRLYISGGRRRDLAAG